MQNGDRDSKPGVGARNVTPVPMDGQAVPAWYAAKQCRECHHMGGWHEMGCAAAPEQPS